jgi:hypothetical protein
MSVGAMLPAGSHLPAVGSYSHALREISQNYSALQLPPSGSGHWDRFTHAGSMYVPRSIGGDSMHGAASACASASPHCSTHAFHASPEMQYLRHDHRTQSFASSRSSLGTSASPEDTSRHVINVVTGAVPPVQLHASQLTPTSPRPADQITAAVPESVPHPLLHELHASPPTHGAPPTLTVSCHPGFLSPLPQSRKKCQQRLS